VVSDLSNLRIKTRLGTLAVRQMGDGADALVLWPSIFTDHGIFDRLSAQLRDRFRVVVIDGPGHGESEGPQRLFTMAECGGAVSDVMDALQITSAFAGGTSWGGIAAAELALAAPERVRALVLMNTPFDLDRKAPGFMARFMTFGSRLLLKAAVFRNGVAKSFFDQRSLRENPVYAAHFHAMLQNADSRVLSKSIRSVMLESSPLFGKLSRIDAPALVIAGRDDAMYPLARQAEAALQMKNSRFEVVSGRHISVIDALPEVSTVIGEFLNSQEPLQ
jgi:3-oxoadipate enol-lactonase